MSDALQKLFDWAEDNHYLTKTKDIINAASRQVSDMEAELVAQAKIIREMAEMLEYLGNWFSLPRHRHQNGDDIRELLNRPEVQRILKDTQ